MALSVFSSNRYQLLAVPFLVPVALDPSAAFQQAVSVPDQNTVSTAQQAQGYHDLYDETPHQNRVETTCLTPSQAVPV